MEDNSFLSQRRFPNRVNSLPVYKSYIHKSMIEKYQWMQKMELGGLICGKLITTGKIVNDG